MTLRVVFMGTPDFAVPTLAGVAASHEVVVAYSRAPAASGRGLRTRPSPVQAAAESLGVPVATPAGLKGEDAVAALRALRPDVVVVVAYGLLLPAAILAVPPRGCLNLHASLLPRWRGAAPIHRAVMAGDARTGIAVMRMEAGLDTGPVALAETVEIGSDETTGELHDRLAVLGADAMGRALDALEAGTATFVPQPGEGIVYAHKIANEEARIVWDRPARAVHDQVRGLSPWPGAFMEADLGRGSERLKVLRTEIGGGHGAPGTWFGGGEIACREGSVRLVTVQRAGRAPMAVAEFLRGVRIEPGTMLT